MLEFEETIIVLGFVLIPFLGLSFLPATRNTIVAMGLVSICAAAIAWFAGHPLEDFAVYTLFLTLPAMAILLPRYIGLPYWVAWVGRAAYAFVATGFALLLQLGAH